MKQLLLSVLGAILISGTSISFADASAMNTLGSAFKNYPSVAAPKQDGHDLTMVYGGADISRRPTLIPHTAAV